MRKAIIISLFSAFVLMGFVRTKGDLFYVPSNWPQPTYDFSRNPLTPEKVLLGRVLFYDPLLSKDNSVSCSSCHSRYNAFTHVDHALSHGIRDSIGTRNSPALMNLAWHSSFMWDGAVNHLDVQALAPITNPAEMDERLDNVVAKLQRSPIYPALFQKAFGDSIVTGEHTLKAISSFMVTLISANSKYDQVMRKEATFTDQEQNGYQLFKKNCSSCHTEPLFTNLSFANNGLAVDPTLNDIGRAKVTGNPSDSFKFKVPTLRNLDFSYPYMHDGRFKKISEVIKHYTSEIVKSPTLAPELQSPIVLTPNERVDLTAFLLTLIDKEYLARKEFSFPFEYLAPPAKH